MKDWQEIRTFLTRRIAGSRGKQAQSFKSWLRKLEKNPQGRILAASMAIDLVSGALEADDLASVFKDMDPAEEPASVAFAKALDEEPYSSRFVCCSRFPEPPDDATPHLYVRILEMDSFITYYLAPTYGYSQAQDDRVEIYNSFLKEGFDFTKLDDLDVEWTGERGRVWVLPRANFESIIKNHAADAATVLNDALGLGYSKGGGPSGKPEFVAVFYPEKFPEKCRQPTFADAQWRRRGFYLSNGKDDAWGRTHSCSGLREPVPERVHRGVPKFSGEGFSVNRIGFATPPLMDFEKLLEAAYERYMRYK